MPDLLSLALLVLQIRLGGNPLPVVHPQDSLKKRLLHFPPLRSRTEKKEKEKEKGGKEEL